MFVVQDKVRQLKEEVRAQYHKMHQLLEDDLGRTLEVLDKAHSKYCQENSTQTLQLNERRQEAKKLLSSVQVVFDKAENINIMKVSSFLPPISNSHSLTFVINPLRSPTYTRECGHTCEKSVCGCYQQICACGLFCVYRQRDSQAGACRLQGD